MKKRNSGGTLFSLLAKNYLAFTLVLLVIVGGIYLLWNWGYSAAFQQPLDVDGMITSTAFREGRYQDVSISRYLGSNAGFAVLDTGGTALYISPGSFDWSLTRGELSCVQEYGSSKSIFSYKYTADSGETRYLLIRSTYPTASSGDAAEDPVQNDIMVLDDGYRVLSGGFEAGRTAYTEKEIKYLTGELPGDSEMRRLSFVDNTGLVRILLLRTGYFDYAYYQHTMSAVGQVWLLVIPLYITATAIFIWQLNRRLRRPLSRLDAAILSLGEGHSARASDCGGPAEIRRLGENFDAMAARLEESEAERKRLDESRQALIADISHDLRTPITVISGYTSAIRDGKVPPEELPRYLEAIDGKATALSGLINTLYEYSKTVHPDFRLQRVETDICEFLREYLAEKYDEIDLAGFSLDVTIPEEPITCRLDAFQFRRALDNILSNSLRHNTLGTVLYAEVRREDNRILIRMADNGCGIPYALQAKLFDAFTVGDESRSGGGSGLGLAITKHIVEAHGGLIRLVVPPSRGGGTEFEITLPCT